MLAAKYPKFSPQSHLRDTVPLLACQLWRHSECGNKVAITACGSVMAVPCLTEGECAFIAVIYMCVFMLSRMPTGLHDQLCRMYRSALRVHRPSYMLAPLNAFHPDAELMTSVSLCRLQCVVRQCAQDAYDRYVGPDRVTCPSAWPAYLRSAGIACFVYPDVAYSRCRSLELLIAGDEMRCCMLHPLTVSPTSREVAEGIVWRMVPLATQYSDWMAASLLHRCALSLPALIASCVRACCRMPRGVYGGAIDALLSVTTEPVDTTNRELMNNMDAFVAGGGDRQYVTVCRLSAAICDFITPRDPLFALLGRSQRRDAIMWVVSWMSCICASTVAVSVPALAHPTLPSPLIAQVGDDARMELPRRMSTLPMFLRLMPPKLAHRLDNCALPTPPNRVCAFIVEAATAMTSEAMMLRGDAFANLASWLRPLRQSKVASVPLAASPAPP